MFPLTDNYLKRLICSWPQNCEQAGVSGHVFLYQRGYELVVSFSRARRKRYVSCIYKGKDLSQGPVDRSTESILSSANDISKSENNKWIII